MGEKRRKYSGQASPLKEIVLDSNCLSQVHRLHYRKTQRPSFETNVRCRYLFAIHLYMCPIGPQPTDKANLWCKILNLLTPVCIFIRGILIFDVAVVMLLQVAKETDIQGKRGVVHWHLPLALSNAIRQIVITFVALSMRCYCCRGDHIYMIYDVYF